MQRSENAGCRPINLEETISHLGGRGLGGALAYIGTRRIEYSEHRIRLYVNGKPGHIWRMTITVSASDLYDLELWDLRGDQAGVLGEANDVYFDELQHIVESLYDTAIGEHNSGFIPLR